MRTESGVRSCLEATRVDVLKEIHRWVESDVGSLFWLHGPAGSGKSTLAQTIAEYYSRPNKNLLDPTILDTKTNQLEKLILDPIVKMTSFLPSRLVVVIDALDECDSDDAASYVIKLLANSLSSYDPPLPLRFLVTSRPEKHLYNFFMRPSTSPNAFPFDLANVDAMQDISLYITHELGILNSTDIGSLVRISEGLFIAASTIVGLLKDSPTLRLQEVLSDGLSGLDSLYQFIMKRAMKVVRFPREQESFRRIIGTIILASARLSMQALLDLLQLEQPWEIKKLVLDGLRSVIHVPDRPNGIVHAFHSSFHDCLVNPEYNNTPWFIDTTKYHGILAKSCLERMDRLLKKDICDLQEHTKKNRDANVREQVKSLPGDLVYASRYWAGHFARSKRGDSLLPLLAKFALEHLLHWIEILCLLDCLSEGVNALQITIKTLKVSSRPFQQQCTTSNLPK